MNIEISASETFLALEDREYIRRRMENALSGNETDIEQVEVWMIEILLAHLEKVQYCLINVKLTDGSLVACDGTHATLKTAINHAVERVSREVTRNVKCRRNQSVGHIPNSAGSNRNTTHAGQMPSSL